MTNRFRLLALAVMTAGCGSKGTTDPTGSIVLTIDTHNATVTAGGTTEIAAAVVRGGSFAGNVDISVTGAPAGVSTTRSSLVTVLGRTTTTITVNIAGNTVPGVYSLTIHATGAGVTESITSFQLTVTAGLGAYGLIVPNNPNIPVGGSGPVDIRVFRNGFTGPVTLSLTGVPAGFTTVISQNPATGDAVTVTVTIPLGTALGPYEMTIHGHSTLPDDRSALITIFAVAAAP